jgi:ribosomal protein S12 methylthiotransferase accessory factor
LTDLVDPRVGIVRSCRRVAKDWREPPRPLIYQSILSNFDYRTPAHTERMTSGKGLTHRDAERGAIVEALERYCAQQQRPGALAYGRASSLESPSIAPEEFVLYSDRQYDSPEFRHRRPVPDEEFTWVRGNLLASGEEVFAPASLVYMNFAGPGGRERLTSPNSSGLAGGIDVPSAVLAALYELVERDAFVVAWLTRLAAPRIDFSDSSGAASEIRRHYERFGVETLAFDLTTELDIPVVMAVGFDRSGSLPAATVGLGCDLAPATALDRAVMEVVQVRSGTVPAYRGEQPPDRIERYEDVRTLDDHAVFAADPEHLAEFDFLVDGAVTRALTDLPDRRSGSVESDLDFCRQRLEASGCKVGYVDLTQPDLEAFGIHVVRGIATGLQPIHFGFGEERLGGRRLFAMPRLLGHTTADLSEDDLNPCPHPVA